MNRPNNTTITQVTKHGVNVIDHWDRQGSVRWDDWTNKDGETFHENRACNGTKDTSFPVTTYDRDVEYFRQFDPRCPACYLNHSHTIEYHEAHTQENQP